MPLPFGQIKYDQIKHIFLTLCCLEDSSQINSNKLIKKLLLKNSIMVLTLTTRCYVADIYPFLQGHIAEHGEDRKSAVETRRTVDDGNHDCIPETRYKLDLEKLQLNNFQL